MEHHATGAEPARSTEKESVTALFAFPGRGPFGVKSRDRIEAARAGRCREVVGTYRRLAGSRFGERSGVRGSAPDDRRVKARGP